MGARRVGGVAGRLATDERFHGRLMDARGLLYAFGLGTILVCCWSACGLGLDIAINAVSGKAAGAAKVGERSAPFTGRPTTQPSRRLAAAHGAVLDLRLGSNLDRSSFENDFGFASNFNLIVTIFGLLSCDGLRWGTESSGRRNVRNINSASLTIENRFEVSYGRDVNGGRPIIRFCKREKLLDREFHGDGRTNKSRGQRNVWRSSAASSSALGLLDCGPMPLLAN